MEDMAYLVSRTLELKIAIAENNNQNTMLVTLDVLKEIFALLKEQERLLRKKQKDIDKLCAEYSNLKHRFHEKTELVRCSDCKYFRDDGYCTYNNIVILKKGYYCADGRRDEDESPDCL